MGCWELVWWAAGIGAVTADALALKGGCTIASARGRLAAAEHAGALESWRLLRDQPALYTATRAGMQAAGIQGMRPARVNSAGALHAIACGRVAAALAILYPGASVVGEPEIRRSEEVGSKPLASVPLCGGGRGPARHRADLVLLARDDGPEIAPVAVEVELTVKAPRRLAAICTAWARCRGLGGVIYVAPAHVRGALARALANARAGDRVVVLDPAELAAAARNRQTAEPSQAPPSVPDRGINHEVMERNQCTTSIALPWSAG
jgi:hypothetical protein